MLSSSCYWNVSITVAGRRRAWTCSKPAPSHSARLLAPVVTLPLLPSSLSIQVFFRSSCKSDRMCRLRRRVFQMFCSCSWPRTPLSRAHRRKEMEEQLY